MVTLIDKLNSRIKNDEYFLDENKEIIKEKIKTASLNLDEHLMSILLSDEEFKKAFFIESNGILVFDKVKFSWIISNNNFLPDSYTSYKNKIGLIDSNRDFLKNKDDVVLSFPFKDCILEFDSTDESENRSEVFLNEIIAKETIDILLKPKAFVNALKITKEEEKQLSSFNDDNLVIKGNNLISMYTLLPKYAGQIKCMYWDILYNTDSDNVPYNDSFKHTSWLVMMKNRLEVAQKLLRKDNGVICIQCDDNEQAYLKVLMDEIFGRDSFINCICVKSSEASGTKMAHVEKKFPKIKDYILIYKSNKDAVVKINPVKTDNTINIKEFAGYAKYYSNIIENIEAPVEEWKIVPIREYITKNKINVDLKDEVALTMFKLQNATKVIYRTNNASFNKYSFTTKTAKVISPSGIEYIWWEGKQMLFLSDYTSSYLCDIWYDISTINLNKEGGVELKAGKKPEKLIGRILESFTDKNDLVLDAYFGSGTTGSVALKLNRRFIGLEQLDSHYEKCIKRLKNVIDGETSGISGDTKWNGGGSFTTFELAKYNYSLIEKINESNEDNIMEIYDLILNNPFYLNYKVDLNILRDNKSRDEFIELSNDDKKKLLIEILDKNLLYINYSDIEDEEKGLSDEDKSFTKSFYGE